MIENILDKYEEFLFGIGPIFFIVGIIFSVIVMVRLKDDIKKQLMGWTIIILLLVFNPITLYLLSVRFNSESRGARLAWGMPYLEVAIIVFVELVLDKRKKIIEWIILLILSIICIDMVAHHMPTKIEERGNLYAIDNQCLEVAKIIENDNYNEVCGAWSDVLDMSVVRQFCSNVTSIGIDQYIVAEEKTCEELYGEKYNAYVILSSRDIGNESSFAESLDIFDVKYYVLSKNSEYKFILDYHDCELIGSTDLCDVYRVNEEEL